MKKILIFLIIFTEILMILLTFTASSYFGTIACENTVREAEASTAETPVLATTTSPVLATTTSPVLTTTTSPVVVPTTAQVLTTTSTTTMPLQTTYPISTRPPKIVPPSKPLTTDTVPTTTRKAEETYNSSLPILYPVETFKTETKTIAITFDDGFNEKAIERVLDVSKELDLKLTFFIVGTMLKVYPELWRQAVEDGHEICNHTYGHCDLNKLSSEEVNNQIYLWEAEAEKVLGYEYVNKMKKEYPFFRLPFGSGSSNKRIMQIISEAGYIPVGWAVETCYAVLRHYNLKSADIDEVSAHITKHILDCTKSGRIVLLHFNSYDTNSLNEIFRQILDKGYDLKPLSEVL